MKPKVNSMEERLARAHLVIVNGSSDSKIREAAALYNYDESRFKEGLELYKKADQLYYRQKNMHIEKLRATGDLHKKTEKLGKKYREHLQLTRMVLRKDSSAVQMLGLSGQRKRRIAGWLEDVRRFYTNALSEPKVIESLSKYAVTRKGLEENKALLEEVEIAAADQEKKKGIALETTKERNLALRELEQWAADFLRICRLALGKDSQHLEKLGIIVP